MENFISQSPKKVEINLNEIDTLSFEKIKDS